MCLVLDRNQSGRRRWPGDRAKYKPELERQASNRCAGNGKRFGVETRRGTSPEIRRSQLILVRMMTLPPNLWLISLVDGAKRTQLERRSEESPLRQPLSDSVREFALIFERDSRRCFVYKPLATNFAPSLIIIRSTCSPSLSIHVTSSRSTTRFCSGRRS
jgi:hypothetical protein